MAASSGSGGKRGFHVPSSLRLTNAGVFYALAVLVVVLTFFTSLQGRPFYLSPTNVSNVLDQTALVGIMAIFTTIVLISGNFDLSIGSSAALGAAVCLLLAPSIGVWPAVAAALLAGLLVGLVNGVIVQYVGINAFIVTLGTLTAVRGLVLIITDGRTITIEDEQVKLALRSLDESYRGTPNVYLLLGLVLLAAAVWSWSRGRRPGRTPKPLNAIALGVVGLALTGAALLIPGFYNSLALSPRTLCMIALALGAAMTLRFTIVGRRLYATGGNPEAARLSGIAVDRYRVVAFMLNGAAAAFVGVLYASRLGSINPTGLEGLELTALAAAILGGTSLFGGIGTVGKALTGALILVTLQNGFNVLNLGANWQGLIEGAVLIVAAGIYTVSGRGRSARRIRDTSGDRPPDPIAAGSNPVVSATGP
ncbi:MAG: ABC transporter permease [Actinomycetes bacterium]